MAETRSSPGSAYAPFQTEIHRAGDGGLLTARAQIRRFGFRTLSVATDLELAPGSSVVCRLRYPVRFRNRFVDLDCAGCVLGCHLHNTPELTAYIVSVSVARYEIQWASE